MDADIPEQPQIISGSIPSAATLVPESVEDPEAQPLLFSFQNYNEKECEINEMEPKQARKSLKAIRDIGINITDLSDFPSKLPKLEMKFVTDAGNYRRLYKGLSPDTEIYEVKTDADKARTFFYIVNKIIFLVAIRGNHYETDKQKR